MKSLIEFYQDQDTRDNVKQYLLEFFKEEAVRRLMNREDAVALADASELVEQAFENMELLFASKSESKETKNPSR